MTKRVTVPSALNIRWCQFGTLAWKMAGDMYRLKPTKQPLWSPSFFCFRLTHFRWNTNRVFPAVNVQWWMHTPCKNMHASRFCARGSQGVCLKCVWSNREYAAPPADATAGTPHCSHRQPYARLLSDFTRFCSLHLSLTPLSWFSNQFHRFFFLCAIFFVFLYVSLKHTAVASNINLIKTRGCWSNLKHNLYYFVPKVLFFPATVKSQTMVVLSISVCASFHYQNTS